ncbi:hypothetical protein [Amycolatopsis sp. NPDC004169]|uniref:hypothetical protein n=1 Tax=Amycolatopsis sp. NPDC004169 TaxID=3154453 RepID=UPI0033B750A2
MADELHGNQREHDERTEAEQRRSHPEAEPRPFEPPSVPVVDDLRVVTLLKPCLDELQHPVRAVGLLLVQVTHVLEDSHAQPLVDQRSTGRGLFGHDRSPPCRATASCSERTRARTAAVAERRRIS